MSDFVVRKGDRLPPIVATLKDSEGVAVNLTGATVVFHLRPTRGGTVKVNAAATVTSAAGGVVTYEWAAADTDTAGTFYAEYEVNWGGLKQSFPNPGFVKVTITDELA
jgi:hypothetical protein